MDSSAIKLMNGVISCIETHRQSGNKRSNGVCAQCPYFHREACWDDMMMDAARYIVMNEAGKKMVEGLADIKDVPFGEPPGAVMERIKKGKGLKPIWRKEV